MSELDWNTKKSPAKNYSLISLDKQDNALNPNRKEAGYLIRGLLVFTTQLSVFIIPFAICNNAGTASNLIMLACLMLISTYSMSAFEPDNPHLDCDNLDLIKKVLSMFWINILRNALFLEYVAYGLLLVFIAAEVISFIAFGNTVEWTYYLITIGCIGLLYVLVIVTNQENKVLKLGRLTPIINLLFNGYLVVLCLIYYSQDLNRVIIDVHSS
jgi:hypothetical protein